MAFFIPLLHMDSYTQLDAWTVGLDLVAEIYELTRMFPKEELYGLSSQVRRASTGILLNLAEGFGRYTYADKANKYTIARGECNEVEACLLIAMRLKYCANEQTKRSFELVIREKKLLSGLMTASKQRVRA